MNAQVILVFTTVSASTRSTHFIVTALEQDLKAFVVILMSMSARVVSTHVKMVRDA